MSHKIRPYQFYDTTASVCTSCLRQVEAKIILKDNHAYMDKWCPVHGTERVLMADDATYYRLCREVYIKTPEMPERFNTKMKYGCPYDCGLCPDHMQHSCVAVIELTDHCNLKCPICYAGSGPERKPHKPLADIIRMLDAVVANEGAPDVVQLSGGEPTLHPDFFTILREAKSRPIGHLMINTNGLRIARDANFAKQLLEFTPGLEIYLQFDSLRDSVCTELRGQALLDEKRKALERLAELDLSTTLVCTLKKGSNDDEIGELIRFALQYPNCRGVTFQPIEQAGRTENYDPALHRLTVSEIRRKIAEQSDLFTLEDIMPVPCNPDTLAMGYALREGTQATPLTRYISPQVLIDNSRNTIVFERDTALQQHLFKVLSTGLPPEQQANCLSELLCCLPKISAPANLDYRNVFRVLIVQFMDALSLDIRALKKSCIHFAQPNGQLIPFESFNLFYRDGRQEILAKLRAELDDFHAKRLIRT